MATPRFLRFDTEGRPLEFSVWLLRARRLLEIQVQAHETLWAHASGDLPEPANPAPLAADPTHADSDRYARERADVTAWKSHDAAACIALSSLLPESEETHFTQVCTASEFLTAIKAHYATPTTVSLGRLFLLFLFLDLALFERTADLITHLRSLDSSYRAACTDAQLALLPPPMAITIYFIATSLPGRLASVRDALLPKHPNELAIEVLELALKDVESNLRSVASASGVVPPPLFHGRGGQGVGGGGGGSGGDVASGGGGSAGARGAPHAAAGDSPAAAGGCDARVRQPPTGLPAAGGGVAAWYLTQRQQQQQPLPLQQPQQQQQVPAAASLVAAATHRVSALLSLLTRLGASLAEVPVASVGTCVDTSPGAAPEDASLCFTLDSGASHCFFRDYTTLTPLPTPVSVALADPTSGPVTARYTTTLPCSAVPSGSLTGFHISSFSRNLVGVRPLVRQHLGVWIEPSGETAVCVDEETYMPLVTFTAEPGSGLYTLHTGPRGKQQQQLLPPTPVTVPCQVPASHQVATSPQVAMSGQVPVSGPVLPVALAHPTILWHHRMEHPSISRLRAMSSQRLVLGLPRVLPSLPPSLAPPCGPYVKGRLRTTPHSSSLRLATETLHLDVWGPASCPGPKREIFFLVVVDDYSRYTTVFPLAKKSDVTSTLIRRLLTTADTRGRRASCLHSDRGGEFCFGILAGFCREQGIRHSWMLPKSPQQNGVAECRIGLVMEIARTSMTHARAPHFLWSYAIRYATHQLNLWPRVSRPEVSPTSLWTGSHGAALRFRVWGCLALVCDTSADKILPRAVSCVFLGFPEDSSDYTFYHPPLHRFFDSRDVRFDKSVPYYGRYPCRGLPAPPAPLFLTSAPPPDPPPTADPAGADFRGEDPGGASSRGAGVGEESVHVRGPSSGGAGVGAKPVTAGDSSLRGAGVSAAVPGGATTGVAPSAGPGEPVMYPINSGGAGSGGGASGSLESGPGATTTPDTTPPPHPYPTWHGWRSSNSSSRSKSSRSSSRSSSSSSSHLLLLSLVFRPSASPLLLLPPPPLLPLPRLSPSVLPSPPESALSASLSTPVIDYYRTYRPVLSRVLSSLVTDPRASLSSVSALTAAVTVFASTRCLDYATSLVAAPPTSPLAVGGESALGCDALEDREFELEFLAATSSHLCAMLLAPEGDPDVLDIPTPRTYAKVPPLGANVVDGMWIFRVKRPPGSPPVFKARYVARGFSPREGVDFFQTFAPTLKMTPLRVLLHVAAQRDYELHSLDFSTAFLQGSLHEEVWLRRPLAFTGTFPPGTQWRLRRPVYGLRQAPREWHDPLRPNLSDLGFQPSSADPSPFVCRGSTPFFVVVYVDDLVFATADRVALADVKLEVQKRHTCTDLGELRHYLGLQITRDRATRTITLSQSHMVQQVLQRFEIQHSTVQRTPLAVDHRLTRPFPDEPFEPSGPYAELVGCLIHRPFHWTVAVRVAKYLATTLGVGLVLGGRQDVVLTGHCDSSYADDAETHRSTQGYCFSLGSGAVSWRSTRSSSVSTSTAEAKIYAGAMAALELRWLTFLLTDLSERLSSAPTLFIDNKATIPFAPRRAVAAPVRPVAEPDEDKSDSEFCDDAVGSDDEDDEPKDLEMSDDKEGGDDDDDVAEEEVQPVTPPAKRNANRASGADKRKGKETAEEPRHEPQKKRATAPREKSMWLDRESTIFVAARWFTKVEFQPLKGKQGMQYWARLLAHIKESNPDWIRGINALQKQWRNLMLLWKEYKRCDTGSGNGYVEKPPWWPYMELFNKDTAVAEPHAVDGGGATNVC
ncbi:unnamed protein product [Closterium sp. NIES-53]